MAEQVHYLIAAIAALFGTLVWLVKFILSTMASRLATKDDLAKLATKEDLQEARARGVRGQRQMSSTGEQPPRDRMS